MSLKPKILLIVLVASVSPAFSWSQALPLFDNAPQKPQTTAEPTNFPSATASPSSSAPVSPTHSPSAGQPVTVPAGTHVMMALKSPLNSTSGTQGSAIYLETLYPVVQENKVVIPAHTLVQGMVTANKRPGHFQRVSEFSFQFKTMIFPNNSVVSIDGALHSIPGSGELRAQGKDGKLKPVDQFEAVIKPTVAGALIGGVIGSATRFGVGKFVGAGLGAGFGLGSVLLNRGDEIRLNQGTNIEMVLRAPVQLSPEQAEFNAKYVPSNTSHE
ncbi:MAG TPA: hypothetical protein VJN64_03740 [Terriglobales bacterium]|nr:hypothetical protein [Terriglobales bacterium]